MRAGLNTIQQTLTPEAASVLTQSISEAARRNHGQTTPLHVASSLLYSPSGILRQACVRSHPNSSHPLQCRALDLCFSVALDRLPSASSSNSSDPPISNALMAALKRAQAHQRRGCPEQQQQPLLAVKVELDQLIVSILDDPSVSRVMREASFSSPAVKAAIEQSIASTSSPSPVASLGLGFRPQVSRGLYVNPRLHQQQRKDDEVRRVLEVMCRGKKKNPVLVGDSEPEAVVVEVLRRIERKEVKEGPLKDACVVNFDDDDFAADRGLIPGKIQAVAEEIEGRVGGGGVVVNLGDLKWLVENPNGVQAQAQAQAQAQQIVSEIGRSAVVEMGKMIARFAERSGRVWLIGTATCATYLRCQVYHPSMESDWDLQAVPIAPKAPVPGLFPRSMGNGILSSSVESLAPHRALAAAGAAASPLLSRGCSSENADPARSSMCPACTENYEQELDKLVAKEFEKSSTNSKPESRQTLPPWLQAAKSGSESSNLISGTLQTKEQELKLKQNTEALLRRWNVMCIRLHPGFHQPVLASDRPPLGMVSSIPSSYNPKILTREQFQPKLSPIRNFSPLQLSNRCSNRRTSIVPVSPPRSPVRTELVLGMPKALVKENNHKDRIKDLSGCTQDLFPNKQSNKSATAINADPDSFKMLFKGLTERVGWQPEAASSVAITVAQCRSGNGKRRNMKCKADTWLLFLGPDKVGKVKMAAALSELLFNAGPTTVSFGDRSRVDSEDIGSNMGLWRMSALDRIAEAVRRNPFSVFVIEDVDHADMITQRKIKQAIERGRLPDSHGREVALGSGIFIMTADSMPDNVKTSAIDSLIQCEEKLQTMANSAWSLELLVGEKSAKRSRGEEWAEEEVDRPTKPRKEPGETGLSLDLNLATGLPEERTGEGSRNSSDLTVEHDHEQVRLAIKPPTLLLPVEMMEVVDDAVTFKPVDFNSLCRKISDAMMHKFNLIVGGEQKLSVDVEALERIVSCIWFGGLAAAAFDEWMESVLVPCLQQLKSNFSVNGKSVMRLVMVKENNTKTENQLPSRITVASCHQ